MDGFNVIPVDIDLKKNTFSTSNSGPNPIELTEDSEDKPKEEKIGSILFVISIFAMLGVFAYFGFLVYDRINMLNEISVLGENLRNLGKNIDKKEMEDFKAMDQSLKSIGGRLSKHVLISEVFLTVNQNIRTNLQISEYRVDVRDKEVEVNLISVAPSFKELAEQTEKLFDMKTNQTIKDFTISGLSFEADTKRVKFGIKMIFDKTKVVATTKI